MTEELKLEQLPMHEIRSRIKAAGLKVKSTNTKVELIEALRSGESTVKEKAAPKSMPTLASTKTEKSLPLLPKNFENNMIIRFPKVAWDIDKESNCLNFTAKHPGDRSVVPSCVNIDSNERTIYKVAEEAARGASSGYIDVGASNNAQAGRIDSEVRERKTLELEIKASMAGTLT